jgi:hypothetical protein
MGLPTPFNPYSPIPNSPFYGTSSFFIQGWQGPLVIGAGLNVDYANSTINSTGGGGGGAVSQIIAGTAISVSPAGGTGNVIVTNTGVTNLVAGAGITVSSGTGSVTIAATGGSGTVTSVAAGSGLASLPNPITTSGTLTLNYACVVDPTDFPAKGAILAGTGVSTYTALPVGLNGLVLTACSACANGMYWGSSSACDIPCSAITAKGSLITGTAASTVFSLGVGSDGDVLTACAASGSGLCWAPASGGVSAATPTVAGTVLGCTESAGAYNTGLGIRVLGTPGAGSAGNVALGVEAMAVSNNAVGNTAVGSGSLCTVTDGLFNTAAGFLSLSSLTIGENNVAIGNTAGSALTTECYNVILGGNPGNPGENNQIYLSDGQGVLRVKINECGAISPDGILYGTSGQVLCSGGPTSTWGWTSAGAPPVAATPTAAGIVFGCTTAGNTAIGCNAMLSSTGAGNTAMGCAALGSVTTGNNNTAFGFIALCSNTGANNTAVGMCAGKTITSGGDNTAIGFSALGRGGAITGGANTGVGVSALTSVDAGTGNTAIGWEPGYNLTTGNCNIAVGYRALGCGSAGVTGCGNIALGSGSLPAVTSANNNIVIGGGSHAGVATGGCNITIGGLNNVPNGTTCFTTIIGNGMTATQSCQVMIGWAGGGTCATFVQGAIAWTVSSDARMKDKVEDLSEGLEVVEKLQPRKYDFVGGIQEGEEGTPAFGLVAQEVAAAIEGTSIEGRGLVGGTEEAGYGLAYAQLTVLLINAVKELSARVKELESK